VGLPCFFASSKSAAPVDQSARIWGPYARREFGEGHFFLPFVPASSNTCFFSPPLRPHVSLTRILPPHWLIIRPRARLDHVEIFSIVTVSFHCVSDVSTMFPDCIVEVLSLISRMDKGPREGVSDWQSFDFVPSFCSSQPGNIVRAYCSFVLTTSRNGNANAGAQVPITGDESPTLSLFQS
jgi:hypothetical protein